MRCSKYLCVLHVLRVCNTPESSAQHEVYRTFFFLQTTWRVLIFIVNRYYYSSKRLHAFSTIAGGGEEFHRVSRWCTPVAVRCEMWGVHLVDFANKEIPTWNSSESGIICVTTTRGGLSAGMIAFVVLKCWYAYTPTSSKNERDGLSADHTRIVLTPFILHHYCCWCHEGRPNTRT